MIAEREPLLGEILEKKEEFKFAELARRDVACNVSTVNSLPEVSSSSVNIKIPWIWFGMTTNESSKTL
jgi:hypothetical protein